MPQFERHAPMPVALDYDTTIIGALELSDNKWVLAVQLPGVKRHTRHVLEANGEELALLIDRLFFGLRIDKGTAVSPDSGTKPPQAAVAQCPNDKSATTMTPHHGVERRS
jgi:hypothetical protein